MIGTGNRQRASRAAGLAERIGAMAVALLLLRSSLANLTNPYVFLDTIYSYRILPATVGLWIAIVLPFLQLVLGICLLAGWWRRPVYMLALALFATFVAVQIVALGRGLEIPCGCFGSTTEVKTGWPTASLAGACALMCAFGWFRARKEVARCPPVAAAPSH